MDSLAVEAASSARRWAAKAWLEMEKAGVLPTPPNFELWFTHVSGGNPELSRQIELILRKHPVMTPVVLETLRASFAPKVDTDEVLDRADGIEQAAQTMVNEVASNGKQLREYGNTLSYWSREITQHRTMDNLVQAVATLAAETARASERNRVLEKQLSVSSARVTRLKDSMADLKRETTTDLLTGLFNRKAFNVRLRRAVSEAKADGSPVSVLMLDVDHFKRVNDTYGHQTGDLVLRLIGRLLSDSVKGRDTSARYGGEEFVVLLPGTDLKGGVALADQIRLSLDDKHLVKKRSTDEFGKITVSIGVAQVQPKDTAASLLDRADAAMYRAKQLGRNQVCASQDDSARPWSWQPVHPEQSPSRRAP
jgi:diguanylate cyclase